MTKLIIMLILVIILSLSGCGDVEEAPIEEEEIEEVECGEDKRCWGYDDICIDNICVDLRKECNKVAMLDYGMKDPSCMPGKVSKRCWCDDSILIKEEVKIEKDNSYEIIEHAEYEYESVIFYLKLGGK